MGGRRGFTLVELVITMAVFAVLSTVGFGLISAELPKMRTRRAAKEFYSLASQCRNLAIQSGRECRIQLVDYDPSPSSDSNENIGVYWVQLGERSVNSASWDTLPVDDDGVDDETGEGNVDFSRGGEDELPWVSLGDWTAYQTISGPGDGGTNENAVVFNPRGFVSNPATDFASSGYIEIPFVNRKAAIDGLDDVWMVRIARSGLVRIDPGTWEGVADEGSAGTDPSSSGSPATGTGDPGTGDDGGEVDTGWGDGGGGEGGGGPGGGEGGEGFPGGGEGGGGPGGGGGPRDSGFPGGGAEGGGGGGGGWDSGFPAPV